MAPMQLAIVLAVALCTHALPRTASASIQLPDAAASSSARRLRAQAEEQPPDWNVHDLKISLYWADDTSYWVPWDELATQTTGNSTYEAFKDRVKPIKDPQLMQMVKCVNDKHDPQKNLTWHMLMSDMGSVRVAAAWWATYPREKQTLTLVSASTLNRLNQVSAQCQSWPGAYSVTLYQPLLQPQPGALTDANKAILRDAVFQIFNFVAEMKQQPNACKPDVLLMYEVFGEPYAKLLFPINILRNLARLQARTPLVALLDVDLVVSQSLDTRLANKAVVDHMITQARTNKTVYIIPAFEVNKGGPDSPAWADVLALATKEAMSKSLKNAVTIPFDLIRSYDGHKLTNFKLWMKTNTDYRVEYEDGCEPWVLGERFDLPWFDPRYRGYGYNKIQHLAIMGAERFQFIVMHDAYCVHRAHKKSEVSAAFSDAALLRAVHGDLHSHNKGMFTGQMSQLRTHGTFKPILSPPSANCKAILPWWN